MIRRYTSLRPSRGTVIPAAVRAYVYARDSGCVLAHLMDGHQCFGGLEIDHVRASGGIGMKSRSTADNLVVLCASGHRFKTENARLMRPILVGYLERVEGGEVAT